MKHILAICIALSITSCVTLIPNEVENGKMLGVMPMQYGRVSYQSTFKLSNNREAAFRQARRWTAFNMANPASALSVSDNLLGDVISRGALGSTKIKTKNGYTLMPSIEYAISIECMDDQYRVTMTNFFINSPTLPHAIEFRSSEMTKKRAKESLQEIDEKVTAVIAEIRSFVENEIKSLN